MCSFCCCCSSCSEKCDCQEDHDEPKRFFKILGLDIPSQYDTVASYLKRKVEEEDEDSEEPSDSETDDPDIDELANLNIED